MHKILHKPVMSALAVLLSVSVVAGCSSNSGNAPQSSSPGAAGSTSKPKTAPVTLKIELFDRSNTPAGAPPITDNFMTQYMQKNFGDPNNIKLQFVTVPRSEEVKKLNVLMAANQAPDIVYTYDTPTVQKYVQDGGLTDLGPLVDQYGDNLKKALGSDLLSYGVFDGKQYAIPAKRVIQAQSTTFIRSDWLKALNLPVPKTTQEFYDTMKAFKEKDPGHTGGKVIPYGQIDYFHMHPLQYSFWNWDQITPEDLYAVPEWKQPGNKEAYRFLNKMYNEGLLDKDFPLYLDKDTQKFQANLVNGLIGSATTNTNEPVYMGYLSVLKKNNANADLLPIDPFTDAKGKHPKPMYPPNGMFIMVPKTSQHAAEAVKYLNWMADLKNVLTLQNGVEGKSYKMVNGLPVQLDTPEAKQLLYNYYDYCILLNGIFLSADDNKKNIQANASDPNFKDFTVQSIETGSNDGIVIPRVDKPVQAEIKYATTLKEKDKEIFVKTITAKPSEFDSVYDKEVQDYMNIGGQKVMDEKKQVFESMKK